MIISFLVWVVYWAYLVQGIVGILTLGKVNWPIALYASELLAKYRYGRNYENHS